MRLLLAQLGSARNATFRLSRAIAADAFYVLLIKLRDDYDQSRDTIICRLEQMQD